MPLVFMMALHGEQDIRAQLLAQKIRESSNESPKETKSKKKIDPDKIITINYENEDLVDIINFIAARKNVNIILPQGGNAIANKVTLHLNEKINLQEAWLLLYTLLDIAGYTLMPKANMYEITKNGQNVTKEPLPLYIGMQPKKLPDTDQRIRYIYYFSNLKASDAEDSELVTVLKNLLPLGTSSYKIDTSTNAVIITAKANDIRATMQIVLELDKIDFQENLEVIKLRYSTARIVADLFNENILKAGMDLNKYRLDARQQTEATFFAKHIRMIPEERTNTLIVLGRSQAIERVKDFIFKYIDVELETGKSILHVYQLQYLDAEKMEAVLKQIIQAARSGGTEQSKIGGLLPGGIQQTFDEVYIKADKPLSGDIRYSGGNKLVVAARNKDWQVLERLIQELDIPQPQVLIEVLIADITLEDFKLLGSTTRNLQKIPLPGTSNFQQAALTTNILVNDNVNPTSIQSDLLRLAFNADGSYGGNQLSEAALLTQPSLNGSAGGILLSLNDNDGKTWNLLQLLEQYTNAKVLSHPHVIATNNQKASITAAEERLLQDEAVSSGGTTTTAKTKKVPAKLTVEIIPRISVANTVHLDVHITIDAFNAPNSNSPSSGNRNTREIQTIAVVKDSNVLAIGGLIKLTSASETAGTPILSKIPIIGYLFKSRNDSTDKSSLTVFIKPTIIEPRLRGGVGDYTKRYINLAKANAEEGALFDSLRDPVTRWFFGQEIEADVAMDEFLAKDEFKRNLIKNHDNDKRTTEDKKIRTGRKRRVNETTTADAKKYEQQAEALKKLLDADQAQTLHVV